MKTLDVVRVSKTYRRSGPQGTGHVAACSECSIDVLAGEWVSLIGESGSGKSTLARLAMRLEDPDSGRILFQGDDLTALSAAQLRRARRGFQMVFQDPASSLNPRWTVARSVAHPLRLHTELSGRALESKVRDLLETVELPAAFADRHPYQLSGGQQQRVCIARAVAIDPKLLVADEATSALDVSTQAKILELLRGLQIDLGMSLLFISHDLRVVRHVSKRVAVMQAGEIVEFQESERLFEEPEHPYTRRLIDDVLPGLATHRLGEEPPNA